MTLCVRFFVPLAALYVIFAIPSAVAQYFASRDLQAALDALGPLIRAQTPGSPPANPAVLSAVLAHHPPAGPWLVFLVLANFFVAPLVVAALIEATCAFYLGRRPTFAQAYRIAVSRWLPLIGVNLLYLGAGTALYLITVIVLFIVMLGIAFLFVASHAAGIAVGIVVGAICIVAVLALAVIFFFALEMSYFTCVVERAPAVAAFTTGFERVLGRSGLRRSLAVGSAYVAVMIGAMLVSGIGNALLVGLLHSAPASAVYAFIIGVAVATFLTSFFAVFYFDLRVREEGLDLQFAAQRSTAPAPA